MLIIRKKEANNYTVSLGRVALGNFQIKVINVKFGERPQELNIRKRLILLVQIKKLFLNKTNR